MISTRDAPGTDDPARGVRARAVRAAVSNFAAVDPLPPSVSGAHLLGSRWAASDPAAFATDRHHKPSVRRVASDPAAAAPRYASPRLDELWDVAG